MKRTLILLPLSLISMVLLGMRQTDVPPIFSHQLHAEAGMECGDCHAATTSSAAADNLLPEKAVCLSCHDESTAGCNVCHRDTMSARSFQRIIHIAEFPHDRHAQKEIGCAVCHAGVEASVKPGGRHLPSMASCQSCHPITEKADYCFVCHARGERLAPADHRLDWRSAHAASAHLHGADCGGCHLESYCLNCHRGDNLDRQVHPLNYVRTHGREARSKRDGCLTCHEEQASCVACHRDRLVLPRSHNAAGWSNLRDGGRHAKRARLDLDACQSCHSGYGEPVCAQCHPAGSR